jgi:hypothetical protein
MEGLKGPGMDLLSWRGVDAFLIWSTISVFTFGMLLGLLKTLLPGSQDVISGAFLPFLLILGSVRLSLYYKMRPEIWLPLHYAAVFFSVVMWRSKVVWSETPTESLIIAFVTLLAHIAWRKFGFECRCCFRFRKPPRRKPVLSGEQNEKQSK